MDLPGVCFFNKVGVGRVYKKGGSWGFGGVFYSLMIFSIFVFMEQEDRIEVREFFKITRTARRTELEVLKDGEYISFSPYPMAGGFLSGVKAGDRHVWVLNDDGVWVSSS